MSLCSIALEHSVGLHKEVVLSHKVSGKNFLFFALQQNNVFENLIYDLNYDASVSFNQSLMLISFDKHCTVFCAGI